MPFHLVVMTVQFILHKASYTGFEQEDILKLDNFNNDCFMLCATLEFSHACYFVQLLSGFPILFFPERCLHFS